jgi:ribonuclease Z
MHERALRAEQTRHTTALQAATLARDAKVEKLCVGHFSASLKDENALLHEAQSVFPNTILANEGLVVSI